MLLYILCVLPETIRSSAFLHFICAELLVNLLFGVIEKVTVQFVFI